MDRIQFTHRSWMPGAALLLAVLSGCSTVPDSPLAEEVAARPACCRENVHVIFVESPFDIAHLARVPQAAREFKRLGFTNTEMFDYHRDGDDDVLADRVREIKVRYPDRRIMMVGYSSSCMIVEDVLGRVEEDGLWIDSVAYIDSFMFDRMRDRVRPQNVSRTLLIYRDGQPVPGGFPNEVEVHRVAETNHFCTVCNAYGFDVMLSEAINLADGHCGSTYHEPVAERNHFERAPVHAEPLEAGVAEPGGVEPAPAISLPEPAELR